MGSFLPRNAAATCIDAGKKIDFSPDPRSEENVLQFCSSKTEVTDPEFTLNFQKTHGNYNFSCEAFQRLI